MGVLDDAIREHLDLKRARGGDPADIERMEREALGPVRREPTIGSAPVGALDDHPMGAHEAALRGDHPADLEELQEQGYHDSTAPHPHADHHHLEAHHPDEHFGLDHRDAFEQAPEQPRRRFLRRNRSAPDETPPTPGFPDDRPEFDPLDPGPIGHHDPLGHADAAGQHDPLDYHESLAHAEPPLEPLAHAEPPLEPLAHAEPLEPLAQTEPPLEPLAHTEPVGHDDPLEPPTAQEQAAPLVPPPHLQFDHPPKRPRFSTDPPELHDPGEPDAAPAAPEPDAEVEVQETTEFDVQRHIAETRHQPDELPPAAPAPTPAAAPSQAATEPSAPEPPAAVPPAAVPPAAEQPGADEDVLEETPEFLQDTPEHDRLWFEQRPPKDFDFEG
jgi:hypothetical protein